jgi:hypothetical protein
MGGVCANWHGRRRSAASCSRQYRLHARARHPVRRALHQLYFCDIPHRYDSLDTLYVTGLQQEFEAAVDAATALGAPRTLLWPTSAFEYNIRIVGGILSAAQLSGDARLLTLAADAAHTLISSAYSLWPSPLMMGRVRMQPLSITNFPAWLLARAMDAAWLLWHLLHSGRGTSGLTKVRPLLAAAQSPPPPRVLLPSCVRGSSQRATVTHLASPRLQPPSLSHSIPGWLLFSRVSRSLCRSGRPHLRLHRRLHAVSHCGQCFGILATRRAAVRACPLPTM